MKTARTLLAAACGLAALVSSTPSADAADKGPCLVWTSGVTHSEPTPDGEYIVVEVWCEYYADSGPAEGPEDPPPCDEKSTKCDGGVGPGVEPPEAPDPDEVCAALAWRINELEAAYRFASDNILRLEQNAVDATHSASRDHQEYLDASAAFDRAVADRIDAEQAYEDAGYEATTTHVTRNGNEYEVRTGYRIDVPEGRAVHAAYARERAAATAKAAAWTRWSGTSDPDARQAVGDYEAAQHVLANNPALIAQARRDFQGNKCP